MPRGALRRGLRGGAAYGAARPTGRRGPRGGAAYGAVRPTGRRGPRGGAAYGSSAAPALPPVALPAWGAPLRPSKLGSLTEGSPITTVSQPCWDA
jgi:hypothetical protein